MVGLAGEGGSWPSWGRKRMHHQFHDATVEMWVSF